VHIGFWCEDLIERDHLEDLRLDGRIILKFIFKKWDGEAGLPWLRIGTSSGYF
jgi:presenilin-like A22 family membrane protease